MVFRAIIIGAGPVGLAMAKALELAGIDYLVLERNTEIAPDMGFVISLFPQSVRLLDQFGLLEEGRSRGWEYQHKHNYNPGGKSVEDNTMVSMFREYHGHPWLYMPRRVLLEIVYKSIRQRDTKFHTGVRVRSIKVLDDGVEVHCENGSVEKGSIVIGCDGIHSITRSEMNRIAQEHGDRPIIDKEPFAVEYRALIGRSPVRKGLEIGHVYETRGKQHSYQVMPSPKGVWWIRHTRVEPGHVARRYSEEDADQHAKMSQDDVVGPGGLTLGDLWASRFSGGAWDLHEGSVDQWYQGGRIVLVGDAVHKYMPTAAYGMNTGWQGVAELANLLRREVLKAEGPDTTTLEATFKLYQSRRKGLSKFAELVSWAYPRMISWHNPGYRLLAALTPYLGGDATIFKCIAPFTARSVVLDYVEESDLPPGTKAWKMPQVKGGKEGAIKADETTQLLCSPTS